MRVKPGLAKQFCVAGCKGCPVASAGAAAGVAIVLLFVFVFGEIGRNMQFLLLPLLEALLKLIFRLLLLLLVLLLLLLLLMLLLLWYMLLLLLFMSRCWRLQRQNPIRAIKSKKRKS